MELKTSALQTDRLSPVAWDAARIWTPTLRSTNRQPTGPPGSQRIMYQLSHLACTRDIWFLVWNWHDIYITCLAAGLNADTTDVRRVMPSCHVMLVTLTTAYFTLSLHKVTAPCVVVSAYTILHTSHPSDWKAGASQAPNPKILRNGMFHNGDTVPYRTTTIIHPPKRTTVQVKVTLQYIMLCRNLL